ncbi:hypothetical protein TTHERM_00085580 (macronuclear) [Tetrahymena thermophila SB210]|uniref:Uncharacterized protein n=1 Tax=Tetrahymena thermophila (strain SB210) TaxID=312017 RepID=Q236P0_TETTS|nr:hypothetical protein TTHERM_00085580 [Tetrahymena thermophila SB210]EAR92460.1 hypothetical protein TTHERM_00085580 [Tetrahymena thermophila SB210]|eukprot:XP_001012705.1 hypothetical protein TTHERM_00085580 [Tetrahymena thermophila SB210]
MAQKQFRLTSDGFRKSVRQEVSQKFSKEEKLFYEVFEEKGYSKDNKITKNSPIFEKKYNTQNDVIFFLIEQVEQQYQYCTVEQLVNKIIDTIQTFHLDNQEDQVEINTLLEYQKMLYQIYDRYAQRSQIQNPKREKCYMEIYHIKNLELVTDIFKYYQIKYKARLVSKENVSTLMSQIEKPEPQFKSIYEQKSQNLWKEPFSERAANLEIVVLGKKKPAHSQYVSNGKSNTNPDDSQINNTECDKNKDYEQISKVVVDFNLIYACIHPKQFENNNVHTKVNIQFKDQTPNAPYTGLTTIQMGFNFTLDTETKLYVMDQLLNYFGTDIDKLNYEISERTNIINDILLSFKQKIVYKQQRGLEENRQNQERDACSIQQCSIF